MPTEHFLGRHPPRTVDAVDAQPAAPPAGGAASAASVPARRRAPGRRRLTARNLYAVMLVGSGLAAVVALMRGSLGFGVAFFLLLFLLVKFSRLGD